MHVAGDTPYEPPQNVMTQLLLDGGSSSLETESIVPFRVCPQEGDDKGQLMRTAGERLSGNYIYEANSGDKVAYLRTGEIQWHAAQEDETTIASQFFCVKHRSVCDDVSCRMRSNSLQYGFAIDGANVGVAPAPQSVKTSRSFCV